MKEKSIIIGGLLASVCVNAVIGTYTETATLLAATPVGIVVYLLIGVGLPQLLVYRQTASAGALGVSVVAAVVSGAVLVAGLLDAGLFSDWNGGFVNVLLVAIVGVLLSVSGHAFAQGYQS